MAMIIHFNYVNFNFCQINPQLFHTFIPVDT